jgi:hypothetical protein
MTRRHRPIVRCHSRQNYTIDSKLSFAIKNPRPISFKTCCARSDDDR